MNPHKHFNSRRKSLIPSWASHLRPCSGVSAPKMVFCLRQSDLGSYRPNEAQDQPEFLTSASPSFEVQGAPELLQSSVPLCPIPFLAGQLQSSQWSRTPVQACACTFLWAFYEKSAALVGKCWPGAWCSNSLLLCTRDLDCSHILTFPRQGRATGLGENAGHRPGFQCLFYERRLLEARSVLFWIKNKT